ncbi:MAG TPA: hypothetical protein VER03_08035 [Bryobacteraceae bacterium]|nr:hypothetical protein [Bryobacteraceae bacterium]
MEPLNDDDLKNLLRKWEAPVMPHALEQKILSRPPSPSRRRAFLKWLMTGSVRVPTPVAIAVMIVCIVLAGLAYRSGRVKQTSLAEFEPVKEFNPRIIRSVYEPK